MWRKNLQMPARRNIVSGIAFHCKWTVVLYNLALNILRRFCNERISFLRFLLARRFRAFAILANDSRIQKSFGKTWLNDFQLIHGKPHIVPTLLNQSIFRFLFSWKPSKIFRVIFYHCNIKKILKAILTLATARLIYLAYWRSKLTKCKVTPNVWATRQITFVRETILALFIFPATHQRSLASSFSFFRRRPAVRALVTAQLRLFCTFFKSFSAHKLFFIHLNFDFRILFLVGNRKICYIAYSKFKFKQSLYLTGSWTVAPCV